MASSYIGDREREEEGEGEEEGEREEEREREDRPVVEELLVHVGAEGGIDNAVSVAGH